jgi:hypothetical protein
MSQLTGHGLLMKGDQKVCTVRYRVQVDPANSQASVVVFNSKPPLDDGELVRVILEDGRVVNWRILDESPYCAVVGDGPIDERRREPRD